MGVWLYDHRNQNSQTPFCTSNPLLASFAAHSLAYPKIFFKDSGWQG
jgi:hypothetical protein